MSKNIRYTVTIDGVQNTYKVYEKILRNKKYYIFLGIFSNKEEIPKVNCAYIYNKILYFRDAKRSVVPIEVTPALINKLKNNDNVDDGKMLRIEIQPEDDKLMVMTKALLQEKKVTIHQFKEMYGDRTTDMSNSKQRLENKHSLSFNKFTEILHLLNCKYNLEILTNDE